MTLLPIGFCLCRGGGGGGGGRVSGISWQHPGMLADLRHRLSASGSVAESADGRKLGSVTPA